MAVLLIVAAVACVYLLTWALCRAAHEGDVQLARMEEELNGGPEAS